MRVFCTKVGVNGTWFVNFLKIFVLFCYSHGRKRIHSAPRNCSLPGTTAGAEMLGANPT